MAWFIERSPITNSKFAAIYISGTPGMDEEDVERELKEIHRLQAIEAAARKVAQAYEPFSSEDHYSAVAKLIAALELKP